MISKKELRDYYSKCSLVLKPMPQWRLYKVQLRSGAWYTIPNQMRNEEMLRKELVRLAPINVFETACAFTNPLALDNENYSYAGHLLLSDDSLFFIDIDDHDVETAVRIKTLMAAEEGFELWKEVNSGNGIHQYYFFEPSFRYRDPLRRLDYQMRQRENLIVKFQEAGIVFDYKCLTDLTRVTRVIGTPNDGDLKKICHEIHSYKGLQRRKPMKVGMREALPTNSRHNNQEGEASRPPSPPALMKFADAVVHGIQERNRFRYIPFMRLNKSQTWQEEIEHVVSFYKLGKTYVFDAGKQVFAIPLRVVDKNRYLKILRKSRASNIASLIKYNHIWIRTSALLASTGERIADAPKYIMTIGDNFPKGEYSRPHYDLLKKMNAPVEEAPILVGNPEMPIHIAYDKGLL